jgi:hypothetical protein
MKRTPLRVLAVAAVLAAGLALAAQPAVARETQATPSPTPTVEVLAPGKAPLEQLRLSPPVGTSQRSSMTVSFTTTQSGVAPASVKPAPIKARVDTTVQGTNPDGNFQVAFSYPSFEVLRGGDDTSAQRRKTKQALAPVTGLSGQMTLTPQGVLVDSSLNVPPGLDSSVSGVATQLGDQLRTRAIPLPDAPVGVGARWRATTDLSLSGIEARQVYEYTLKKRTGSKLEIEGKGTQTAGQQTVDLSGVVPGATADVTKYRTTVRGENTVQLTSAMPTAGQEQSTSNRTFRIKAGNNSGTLQQRLTVNLVLKPATG